MARNGKGGVTAAIGLAAAGVLGGVALPEQASAAPGALPDKATNKTAPQATDGALYYLKDNTSVFHEMHAVDAGGDQVVVPPSDPNGGMAWSPDGSKVAIASNGSLTIYDANFQHPVVIGTASPSARYGQPRWLPDGSGIAYIYNNLITSSYSIWTVSASGTGAAALHVSTDIAAAIVDEFDITPGGDYLIRETVHTAPEIDLFHPGATSATVLTTANVGKVAAAPDGTHAVITQADSVHPENGFSAFSMNLATKATTPIIGGLTSETPVVSPDGKHLAVTVMDSYLQPGGPGTGITMITGTHTAVEDLASGIWTAATPIALNAKSFPIAWRPIPGTGRTQVDRVAGADRIGTAIATSQLGFNDKGTVGGRLAQSAVLSRSDTFADALAGGALAARKHGPLLLTPTGTLDPKVATELTRVLAPHATVYLLGGTSALSDNVLNQVAALGFTPVRVWGPDRDATAVAIAGQITSTPHVFLVATGRNFPDALAAGAAAGAQPDAVVLLSDDNTLSAGTKNYLTAHLHSGDVLLGVGNQGSNALESAFPVTEITSQLRGTDRFDTATKLADFYYSAIGAPKTVGVATGFNWPDALGGGALLGAHPGPLLLTGPGGVSAGEAAYLSANSAGVQEIVVFGGIAVVPPAAETSTANTAVGAANWDGHVNRVAPPLP